MLPLRPWVFIVPLVGMALVAALPAVWAAQGRRDEEQAIAALGRVREAQERFRAEVGDYATDLSSLTAGCGGAAPAELAGLSGQLRDHGYALTLRAREGTPAAGQDCHGRPTGRDYYVAAAPVAGRTNGHRAYAALADGRIYVFFDQVAPRETEIAAGLSPALDTLDHFTIP